MSLVAAVKELFTTNLQRSGIYVAFVAIIVFFAVRTNGLSLGPENLTNIVLQYSYVLILAIGMVIVIIAGHIDLSVGSVVALVGGVSAQVVVRQGMPWWAGILAGLAVGVLIGAWQGFWVAFVGIPAFIVTLAGMLLFRGLAGLVLNNLSLGPYGKPFTYIAAGFENGWAGGNGYDVFTLLVFGVAVVALAWGQWRARRARLAYQQSVQPLALMIIQVVIVSAIVMWFAWRISHDRGLPYVLVILAALVIAYTLVTQKSVFGRHVYALGGNRTAAALSGVKVRRVNFGVMLNMGVLAAVAGLVFSARSNAAQPGAGNGFELDAIAACFIGGASVYGGVGTVPGAMVGGLIMAVMSNGMQLLGMETSPQQVVKGMVLLLAVAFDIWNKKRSGAVR
jgi:putative multiple sugar transport system permease protein